MTEWCESEVVVPNGTYQDRPFRYDRQPILRSIHAVYDGRKFRTHLAVGPQQSGKSWGCLVLPLLWTELEEKQTSILGLPDMGMGGDWWDEKIRPPIEASRYKEVLPTKGAGSKGGKIRRIAFRNGVHLRFMSAGGNAKGRSSYTALRIFVTESEGLARRDRSAESTALDQIVGRGLSDPEKSRVWMECILTTEEGQAWKAFHEGTRSTFLGKCPHCGKWVAPDREHFQGWQEAKDEKEAEELAHFVCPQCQGRIGEAERRAMVLDHRLIHAGQWVDQEGKVQGEEPRTYFFTVRWTAFWNLFAPVRFIGLSEWKARFKETDPENAERKLCQQIWGRPYQAKLGTMRPVTLEGLAARMDDLPKGLVPAWADLLIETWDLGMWTCWRSLIAWRFDGQCHLVEYDSFDVPSDRMAVELALAAALSAQRDVALCGYTQEGSGEARRPEAVWIDAKYKTAVVAQWCAENGAPFAPYEGLGTRSSPRRYTRPKGTSREVIALGDGYHWSRDFQHGCDVVQIDANEWKTKAHEFVTTPLPECQGGFPAEWPGALTVYKTHPNGHAELARHYSAEQPKEEFVEGKGPTFCWYRLRKANHWWDNLYSNCAAAHWFGVRVVPAALRAPAPTPPAEGLTMPDGRPFVITERI